MTRWKFKVISDFELGERPISVGEIVSATMPQAEEFIEIGYIMPVDDEIDAYIEQFRNSSDKPPRFRQLSAKYIELGLSSKKAREKAFIETFCTHADCVIL